MNPDAPSSTTNQDLIIVVDDDEAIRSMLKVTLEHEGFHIICASNSKDIVSLQRIHKPALIIMDLIMPEHEGMEGIFSLMGASTVPIIAISSNGNFLHIVEKLVALTLSKPFSSDTILYNVKKYSLKPKNLNKLYSTVTPEPEQAV